MIRKVRRTRSADQIAALDAAMTYERECQEAWNAARSAKPFNRAAEQEAFENLLKAEQATMEASR